jgi:hypothetical protein
MLSPSAKAATVCPIPRFRYQFFWHKDTFFLFNCRVIQVTVGPADEVKTYDESLINAHNDGQHYITPTRRRRGCLLSLSLSLSHFLVVSLFSLYRSLLQSLSHFLVVSLFSLCHAFSVIRISSNFLQIRSYSRSLSLSQFHISKISVLLAFFSL